MAQPESYNMNLPSDEDRKKAVTIIEPSNDLYSLYMAWNKQVNASQAAGPCPVCGLRHPTHLKVISPVGKKSTQPVYVLWHGTLRT